MNIRDKNLFRLSFLLTISGCNAFEGDAYQLETLRIGPAYERSPGEGELQALRGIAVDAKQRFVWTRPRIPVRTYKETLNADGKTSFISGGIERRAIVCAEPSPDALTAIANAFDSGLKTSVADAAGDSGSVAANLSASLSETAQILGERTQTIQLLRDAFYRACESYGNGAIDDFGYSLILGQIDLFMIQLLAVDALGRTQGREGVATKQSELDSANAALATAQTRLLEAQAKERSFDNAMAASKITADPTLAPQIEALETREMRLTDELQTLNGPKETAGSIEQARSQLNEAVAAEAKTPPAQLLNLENELKFRRDARDQKRLELDTVQANISTKKTQQNNFVAAPAPTGDEGAIRKEVSDARSDLNTKAQNVAIAKAALATARGGVGPQQAQANELLQIVKQTFDESRNAKVSRATRVACLQWFARNPNITNHSSESSTNENNKINGGALAPIPAIAGYCDVILKRSILEEGSNKSTIQVWQGVNPDMDTKTQETLPPSQEYKIPQIYNTPTQIYQKSL